MTDNKELYKKIDRVVFDTVAMRRSIKINSIGLFKVEIVPRKKSDKKYVPSYRVVFSGTDSEAADVLLDDEIAKISSKESSGEVFNQWLTARTYKKNELLFLDIPNVFIVGIDSGGNGNITHSKELALQLAPFSGDKTSNRGAIVAIVLSLFGFSLLFFLLHNKKDNPPVQIAKTLPSAVVSDTLNSEKRACDVPNDSITPPIDRGVTYEYYVIAGSFKTSRGANREIQRLRLKYPKLHIQKMFVGGRYLNYIDMYHSEEVAQTKRDSIQLKYPDIKGLWVHTKEIKSL